MTSFSWPPLQFIYNCMEVGCNRETASVKAAWSLKTDQWSAEADLITMTFPKCPLQIVPSCTFLLNLLSTE